jgi:hypothetical protein
LDRTCDIYLTFGPRGIINGFEKAPNGSRRPDRDFEKEAAPLNVSFAADPTIL